MLSHGGKQCLLERTPSNQITVSVKEKLRKKIVSVGCLNQLCQNQISAQQTSCSKGYFEFYISLASGVRLPTWQHMNFKSILT